MRSPARSLACAVAVFVLLAAAPACYTTRVVSGGANLLIHRRPVEKVLARDELPADERRRLELAQELRAFAVSELALPDNGSYTSYVALDRAYVTWNVVAAPELSVDPVTWCFPVVGCVAYRGYFKEKRARRFADKLAKQGHDVRVGGVDAYSTLGKFADPLLSTFLRRSDTSLAGLIFHELAHQVLYVRGDTTFNESFATVVENEGVDRWLAATGREAERPRWEHGQELERRFTELLLDHRNRLEAMYESAIPDDEKRRRKSEILGGLPDAYAVAKRDWGGDDRYDAYVASSIDNAALAGVANYHAAVPALTELLRQADGSFETFFARAIELGELDAEERRQRLDELATPAKDGSGRSQRPPSATPGSAGTLPGPVRAGCTIR